VFENRVLRKVYGPEREELTGDCKIIHNFYSRFVNTEFVWVNTKDGYRCADRRRSEDNVKMDLK
jgi:hypothetical protein